MVILRWRSAANIFGIIFGNAPFMSRNRPEVPNWVGDSLKLCFKYQFSLNWISFFNNLNRLLKDLTLTIRQTWEIGVCLSIELQKVRKNFRLALLMDFLAQSSFRFRLIELSILETFLYFQRASFLWEIAKSHASFHQEARITGFLP